MTDAKEFGASAKIFSPTAPIFVQPHLALFPGSSRIVSVSEPLMQVLASEQLRDKGLIAVALLRPGWERAAGESADYHEIACLARIVNSPKLSSAASRVQLAGICRARVLSEVKSTDGFCRGRLEFIAEHCAATPHINRRHRHVELISLLRLLFPHIIRNDLFQSWIDEEMPLGSVCDMIADMLCIDPQQKQELLAERDVDLRSDLLLSRLRTIYRQHRNEAPVEPDIPLFSAN